MNLFLIGREARQALREVLEWERANPEIANRDTVINARLAEKAKEDAIKRASEPVQRVRKARTDKDCGESICVICEAKYTKFRPNQTYCSNACRAQRSRNAVAAYKRRKKAEREEPYIVEEAVLGKDGKEWGA